LLVYGGGGGCEHCNKLADAAVAQLEHELPGIEAEVRAATDASAAAFKADPDTTWRAFALAARYQQPQRAITCALHGFALGAIQRRLADGGHQRELHVLRASSEFSSYAWALAAPIDDKEVVDDVFATAMRMRMCAPILAETSTHCQTVSGGKPRRCTIDGCAAGNPDAHALSCKCGGHSISTHNAVRSALYAMLQSWGVFTEQECHRHLTGGSGVKMDLMVHTAGLGRSYLAIDLTRRFAATHEQLIQAELGKEEKYAPKYVTISPTIRGFAFDELGACGPHAMEAANLLIRAGARIGAGHQRDLQLEFWAVFGLTLAKSTAERFAHFAGINGDTSHSAPQERALAPGSGRRATGASYRLADVPMKNRKGRRATKRSFCVPPKSAPPAGAALSPSSTQSDADASGATHVPSSDDDEDGSSTDSSSSEASDSPPPASTQQPTQTSVIATQNDAAMDVDDALALSDNVLS